VRFPIPFITILPNLAETKTETPSKTKESEKAAPDDASTLPYVMNFPASEAAPQPQPTRPRKKTRKSRGAKKVAAGRHLNHPAAADSQSFAYTAERKERMSYVSSLQNGDKENFFGKVVSTTPVEQTLNVHHLDAASSQQPILEVVLQGATAQAHQVQVQLNGVDLGAVNFMGQTNSSRRFAVSPVLLRDGDNTVKLITQAGEADVNLVDALRLTYAHLYRADNNRLHFTVRGPETIHANGFSSPDVRVMDVTDPGRVQEIVPQVQAEGGGYAITLQVEPGQAKFRSLLAFTADQFERPAEIKANQPSDWARTSTPADFLIITNAQFSQSVEPLAALRRSQGMTVAVIDVEDVYDEFSYGAHSPQAVKAFLAWATERWTRAPRFVLLVGDGSYDPRNYQGRGQFDLLPTKMVDTRYMETADDDWFADFNDDGIPEMAVGRLPVRTAEEAQAVVSKIVGYTPPADASARGVLLISDRVGPDGFSFEGASAELKALVPNSLSVQTVVRSNEEPAATRTQIVEGFSKSPLIANYAGHGTYDRWTGDGVLKATDAPSLANGGKASLLVTMTCMNGYYHNTTSDSLAEAMLKVDNGGAVAVWASSGITVPTGQAAINQELYEQLFGGESLTLGEAVRRAKAATADLDVRRTWVLFGDPTMRIR
jgi:hypothetical protein